MNSVDLSNTSAGESMETIVNTISNSDWKVLLEALACLIVFIVATRLIIKVYNKTVAGHPNLNPMVVSVTRTAIIALMVFLGISVIAGMLGIQMTSFVALFSVIGLAVTLAIQGILSSIAGGLILLTTQPFKIGDFIETDSLSGTVASTGFLSTRLIAADGRIVFIPNSVLYTNNVINYTANGKRRIELSVSASYDNTPDEVRAAIQLALHQTPELLPDPEPVIHLESYDASSISYTIWCWVKSSDFVTVKYALNERLYNAFAQKNVVMTYDHLNVHIRDETKVQ